MTSRSLIRTSTPVVMAVVALSACSQSSTDAKGSEATGSTSGSAATSAASTSAAAAPATFVTTPRAGARGVDPAAPLTVAVKGGRLTAVTVTEHGGAQAPGALQGTSWVPARPLKIGTAYDVKAVAERSDGVSQTGTSSFTILTPDSVARYALLPTEDVVGVGMPVMVTFNSKVETKAEKAAVERQLRVTTAPAVAGTWGWLDDRRVMWRPAAYWKPGTKVTVTSSLDGVKTGEDKYVGRDDTESFTIGRSQVSTVDIKSDHMTVRRDGKVIRVIPVTTGKAGFTTRSGIKVIMEKVGHMTMDSETVGIPKGDPNYYKLDTEWNMRLTTTGEFLHAAPWSQWAQGSQNVSHGCTNMSMANANWLFAGSMIGDVVEFTGSDKPFLDDEGITVWQYSYADWQKKSALR